MSKNNNREEILQRENQLLKEILGLESQLDDIGGESESSGDMFASLRELTMPPKRDASFYVGNMPPPYPFRRK